MQVTLFFLCIILINGSRANGQNKWKRRQQGSSLSNVGQGGSVKIRSITMGLAPGFPLQTERIKKAGLFAKQIKTLCEEEGYEVQTLRLATPPFPQYLTGQSSAAVLRFAQELEACCVENGLEYCALGPVDLGQREEHAFADLLPDLIAQTEVVFASVRLGDGQQPPSASMTQAVAEMMRKIARSTADGFGNLRFAAGIHIRPHTPFFPAAYHSGTPAFGLACQAADVVASAANADLSPADTVGQIRTAFERQLAPLERRLQKHGQGRFRFVGYDLSPAPGPGPDGSIARAIESISGVAFGAPGTLAAAALVTAGVKETALQQCGYCGLMLPVLEDAGLAACNDQGNIRLSQLLTYSAVCGTGLDTIPLAGDVSQRELAQLLSDVNALGWKLEKPLSVRLLPIPGKRVGEMTTFDFPFFVNTRVMAVD